MDYDILQWANLEFLELLWIASVLLQIIIGLQVDDRIESGLIRISGIIMD